MRRQSQIIVIERYPAGTGCLVRTEPVRVLRYEEHIEVHAFAQSYARGLSSATGMQIVDRFVTAGNVPASPLAASTEPWCDASTGIIVFTDGLPIIHNDETLELEEYGTSTNEIDTGEAA